MKVKDSIKNNKFARFMLASLRSNLYSLGLYKCQDEKAIEYAEMYSKEEDRQNKHYIKTAVKEAIFCNTYYRTSIEEYFLFGFRNLNSKGRAQYVGKVEKAIINHRVNEGHEWNIFSNKWLTYKYFERFFKRDVIKVEVEEDWSAFLAFTEKHASFIVKAVSKSCGESVFIVHLKEEKRQVREIFEEIRKTGFCVVEELVVQCKEMSKLHPNSVNTIRVATFQTEGNVHFLFSGIRMGVHGNIVDNAGAGGLVAGIDVETGIVYTPGYRYNGEVCIIHPDSGQQIVGMHIPQWEELTELVTELAMVIPSQRLIGWDLAFTEKGWVMIEGNQNSCFAIAQIWDKKGLREKLAKVGIV